MFKVLAVLLLTSGAWCSENATNKSFKLNQLFTQIFDGNTTDWGRPPFVLVKHVSRKCVHDKLDLDSNGEKILPEMLDVIATALAFFECSSNRGELIEAVYQELTRNFVEEDTDSFACLEKFLAKLEPKSTFVMNSEYVWTNDASDDCKLLTNFEDNVLREYLDDKNEHRGLRECGITQERSKRILLEQVYMLVYQYSTSMRDTEALESTKLITGKVLDELSAIVKKCINDGPLRDTQGASAGVPNAAPAVLLLLMTVLMFLRNM